jgi:hypothetical protein
VPAFVPLVQRVWSKVDIADPLGCWVWRGTRNREGYGLVSLGAEHNHRTGRVHRWVYEQARGPIPKGLVLDHLCRVRSCCNPTHLEAVTHTENQRRSRKGGFARENAAKTECPRGHAFADHGYVDQGKRRCRVCRNAWKRKYERAQRAR